MFTPEAMPKIETATARLSAAHRRLLERTAGDLKIAADLAHADLLILCPTGEPGQLVVVSHAQPTTAHSLYSRSRCGDLITVERGSPLWRSFKRGRPARELDGLLVGGMPVEERVTPMRDRAGRLIAVLDMHRSAYYRRPARRPHQVLREAAAILSTMIFADAIDAASMEKLIHAGDGIVVYDPDRSIIYADARARAIYRKLGLRGVMGMCLDERELPGAVVLKTNRFRIHSELEIQIGDAIIIKRVIPLSKEGRVGQLAVICDVTDLRRRERQRLVTAAVIQEIHHRVKNNLQTIASLLRLQLRRASSETTRRALRESVSRILSIATVHDFLSREGTEAVDLKELGSSLLHAALSSNHAAVKVRAQVSGPHISIRPLQATPLALALNELALNAVEHAFRGRDAGQVSLTLRRQGEHLVVEMRDDGVGLPAHFSLDTSPRLGLQIVGTLVTQDLKGHFEMGSAQGTWARITVPLAEPEQVHE